jgi:hypothetical protein
MPNLGMSPSPSERRRRGCFGCLTRLIGILLVGLVVSSIFLVAAEHVFHPWSFYFSGHSHLFPAWAGVGRAHTDRGDYTLTVFLQPTRGGRTFNLPSVKGTGYLCTPRGERFRLFIYGGMSEKTGTDSNGKPMHLRYFRHSFFGGINGNYEQPPRVELHGTWQNPDLVMDDGGSLAAAFLPDGSVNPKPQTYYHAEAKNKVPVVFHEVSIWQGWDDHCQPK